MARQTLRGLLVFPKSHSHAAASRIGPLGSIAIGLGVLLCLWKRSRPAFFFASFGFLNLLPASNLLFPIGTIMAERLLYLPLAGWLACLALLIDFAARRFRQTRLTPVVIGVIAAGFAIRTWVRNNDWKDNLTMATASVQTSPSSFKVHRLLAASLFSPTLAISIA